MILRIIFCSPVEYPIEFNNFFNVNLQFAVAAAKITAKQKITGVNFAILIL